MAEKRAVIYARVSTHRQARDELPLDSQLDRCRRHAETLGAAVTQEFVDEGLSGREADRPAFQAAIDHCERHAPDYLICWSTSRIWAISPGGCGKTRQKLLHYRKMRVIWTPKHRPNSISPAWTRSRSPPVWPRSSAPAARKRAARFSPASSRASDV